jgi:hypothetical protein
VWRLEHRHVVAIIGESLMLRMFVKPLAAGGAALLALAACGSEPSEIAAQNAAGPESSPTSQPKVVTATNGDLCAALAKVPDVQNEDGRPGELVRTVKSTTANVDTWLAAERTAKGGPKDSVASFQGLDAKAGPNAPLTVCVYKVDPRPIPVPEEVKTVANGISVFVQDSGAYFVEGIGSVDTITKELDTLKAAEPVK